MGDSTLVYKTKFQKVFQESQIHLKRIDEAFSELGKSYEFPLVVKDFDSLTKNRVHLAFADQIIYRFSKAQDSMGGKLFKAYMLYQGTNVDKPFLDILNSLEKLNILEVDEWFELREIRNEIAHDYADNEKLAVDILNNIFKHKKELENILSAIALKS
ncbi:hypothetical protein [Sulfurimonas sp.]|jgi:hypothetical protein|uniref:hypothetical protein n=1 Tax=Sulfurimonas sp. TaxID=2022749 RepID=UPI0025E52D9A|nr:hypothetical protein [Sulfurimonas sp.]MBT5933971.1 hypothetical protein [Sulfurimonas sp.]